MYLLQELTCFYNNVNGKSTETKLLMNSNCIPCRLKFESPIQVLPYSLTLVVQILTIRCCVQRRSLNLLNSVSEIKSFVFLIPGTKNYPYHLQPAFYTYRAIFKKKFILLQIFLFWLPYVRNISRKMHNKYRLARISHKRFDLNNLASTFCCQINDFFIYVKM